MTCSPPNRPPSRTRPEREHNGTGGTVAESTETLKLLITCGLKETLKEPGKRWETCGAVPASAQASEPVCKSRER